MPVAKLLANQSSGPGVNLNADRAPAVSGKARDDCATDAVAAAGHDETA
jgi:hypothetical protein